MTTLLVTGGYGFIGSNFILRTLSLTDNRIVNLDAITYAANPSNLSEVESHPRLVQVKGNICDRDLLDHLLHKYNPAAIIHFAAESHVDRSILGPDAFLQTNIVGTFMLLEAVRVWWETLGADKRRRFRLVHVSTDEVFGSLRPSDAPFHEKTPYAPNSPYAASKAASDHFVRAYHHTYGIPVLITNCSNNYGPRQHPEKFIPLMITRALEGKDLPVYGDGRQVRDWLFVSDHCEALDLVLERGCPGETYNIGGAAELCNIDLLNHLCSILNELKPRKDGLSYDEQIRFVADRPGHDRRYAMDINKIYRELGWKPVHSLEKGLRLTVEWYLENISWIEVVTRQDYSQWIERNYEARK